MKKLIIITGASSGIGKELAKNYANKNLRILAIARSVEPLRELHESYPDNIDFIQSDICDPTISEKIKQYLNDNNFKIKQIIHSAAIIEPIKPIQEISKEEWNKIQDVNVTSSLFLTLRLKDYYIDSTRVLFIGSGWGSYASKYVTPYCVSKAGLSMLYDCLKIEMPEINFGIVNPGIVATKMQSQLKESSHFDMLDSPHCKTSDKIAEYISWIMMSTNDEDFSAEEWNLSSNMTDDSDINEDDDQLYDESEDEDDGGRLYH